MLSRVQEWLDGPYDEKTKGEIRRLERDNPKALEDAFFKDLSFGTGGMRGVMGVGTNRMNVYTIRRATQGLANFLLKMPYEKRAVFIGYDVRHHSFEFAQEAAAVLLGNGIEVYLTREICPTPLVSFGCRHWDCQAAIMITASHNPPEYNGYKVYGADGAQLVAPHDGEVMEEVAQVKGAVKRGALAEVFWVGEELYEAYLKVMRKLQLYPDVGSARVLYTPLHGTGIQVIPRALKEWGFEVRLVEAQSKPDGNFSAAPSPNPEEAKALALGEAELAKGWGDLLIATDPDADRVGVALPGGIRLSGNQTGCLLLHHICGALSKRGELPENGAFVKTIVTTELFRKIAEDYGATCVDVLTGFKYIGEKIAEWEKSFEGYQFLFGAEESYGYLFGSFVRDKDAVSASCLIAEAAAVAKRQNLTLYDRLLMLYQKYGIHRETLVNLAFSDTPQGIAQMNSLMERLRSSPPKKIGGIAIRSVEDYLSGKMRLPKSDVLRFWFEDESKLVIRPSGTEPKIKIYAEVVGVSKKGDEREIAAVDQRLKELTEAFQREFISSKGI